MHAAHTATSINNGGLRGPPQQQLQQQELHPNGSIGIPQHGQQSPKREQHNRRRRELLQGEKGRTNPLQSIYEENLKRKADNLRIRQQQYAKKKKQQQMVQNADRFKKKNQNNGGGGSRLKTKKQQNTNNDGSRPGRNPNGTKRPKKGRPGSNNNMGRPKLGRPGRNPNNGNKRPNKNKKPNRPWKPSNNNMRPNNGLLTKKPGNPQGFNDKKPGNPPGINGNKKPDNTNNIKPQSQQVNNKPQDEDDSSSKPGKDQNKPSKEDDEIVDMSSSIAATTDNKPSKDKPDYIVVKPGKNNPQEEEEEDIVNMASSVTSAVDSIQPVVTSNNDKPGKDKPEQGVVKPGKMSPFEIALAHMHITMSEYDNLSKEKQDEIKALVDGKFNLGLMMEEQSDAATTVNNDGVVSGQVIELDWNFVPSVKDTSSLLDSFEHHPDLNWDNNDSSNDLAWSVSDVYASEGDMSIQSGISNVINSGGDAVYSNLTLVTEPNFVGGVLTFKVLSNSLTLPLEAFWVEVDDDVMLTPDVTASKSTSGSSSSGSEWVEYSVPVNDGRHNVKWVHVYNPFSLPSLPPPPSGGEVGAGTLYMDELRHVPFTTTSSNVEMTRSGKNGGNNDGASWWDITKNGSTIVATSSSMSGNRGSYTDVNFDLYTLNGGTLVYDVQTSTTAPHDDMTILINNEIVEAIFGDMIGYERRELVVPKGKAGITLRHRKNPGGLSGQVLRSLGVVGTEGKTWLKELGFVVG